MTYTEAAKNNENYNLSSTWREPKDRRDEKHLKWVKDTEGKIGFIIPRTNGKEFLVAYPVRVLKASFTYSVRCWPLDDYKNFEQIIE